MIRSRVTAVALVVFGILLVVVPLGLRWSAGRSRSQPVGTARPLSTAERAAVHRQRTFADTLPAALAQIPIAVADGSTGRPSGASADGLRILNQNPDLVGLARLAEQPSPVVTPLVRALAVADATPADSRFPSVGSLAVLFGVPGLMAMAGGAFAFAAGAKARPRRWSQVICWLAAGWLIVATAAPVLPSGRSVVGEARASADASRTLPGGLRGPAAARSLQTDLALLQNVYADVVPAVQAGAVASGRPLTNAEAGRLILADPRLPDLQHFLKGLSGLYGAGVLAVQASASNASTTQVSAPLLVLVAMAAILALALLLLPLLASAGPTSGGRLDGVDLLYAD